MCIYKCNWHSGHTAAYETDAEIIPACSDFAFFFLSKWPDIIYLPSFIQLVFISICAFSRCLN